MAPGEFEDGAGFGGGRFWVPVEFQAGVPAFLLGDDSQVKP